MDPGEGGKQSHGLLLRGTGTECKDTLRSWLLAKIVQRSGSKAKLNSNGESGPP